MGSSATRICVCLFFAFALVSSSPVFSVPFPGQEGLVKRRSLMVSTADYDGPSANGRHNPPGRRGGGGGGGGNGRG